ncbi:MAG: purine-nucleoside phosphorylase [Endomicrobiales bacterium]|nr:purine-nucleoside phosphorylase [Endomicrobiales bacterium]
MTSHISKLEETTKFIKSKTALVPKVGVILGSGLGDIVEGSINDTLLNYEEIPHFAKTTVKGHKGKLLIGKMFNIPAIIMQGRLHYYEGYCMDEVTYPIYLMKQLGVEYLVVTAAAGGINKTYRPGDIVVISDHINLMGKNPLRGENYAIMGERFPDMTLIYNSELSKFALGASLKHKIRINKGVYLGVQGPSYETPAEVKAFRTLGADLVGMSVIPETIVANKLGIKVLGLAYISNMAAGVIKKKLTHEEVLKTGVNVIGKLSKIIEEVFSNLK